MVCRLIASKTLFDVRSGLLLCIRLLGEAMDMLRAVMESIPHTLLIVWVVSIADRTALKV